MRYALTHTCLERVVIGVARSNEVTLAGEILPERSSRAVDGGPGGRGVHSVLSVRSAGGGTGSDFVQFAHAQTKRRVSGIGLQQADQMMALRTHIAERYQ